MSHCGGKFFPNDAPREGLGLLEQREASSVVPFEFGLAEPWLQQCHEQGLCAARVPMTCGDPVDRRVEEVEPDAGAPSASDELLHDRLCGIIEQDDVVAVPTDATGDVQEVGT